MLHVREALAAELEEQAATADKAVRRHEHRKRQRQARTGSWGQVALWKYA